MGIHAVLPRGEAVFLGYRGARLDYLVNTLDVSAASALPRVRRLNQSVIVSEPVVCPFEIFGVTGGRAA